MDKYNIWSVLGQGTYGKVYKAQHVDTDKVVAIKKTLLTNDDEGVPPTTLREVSILRALKHPYIVDLLEVIHTSKGDKPILYLVFEFLDYDLKSYMAATVGRSHPLPINTVKHFTFQILLGLKFCHTNSIMHRDLKPQNLLVVSDKKIKLADFGLGRVFTVPVAKYTHEVVTLWYRAPEILLGTRCYSTAVDLWSVGCIMAEMARGKTLFTGESEIEQLLAIFRFLGTPSEASWPQVDQLKDWHDFPQWKPKSFSATIPVLGDDGCDLLTQMMCLNPTERITAIDAIEHPFFDDLRHEYPEARGVFEDKENAVPPRFGAK